MQLRRRTAEAEGISLVSMIDVLMIMLIFFMVTSTFLNLDMVPLVDGGTAQQAAPASQAPMMIRLDANGRAWMRGQTLDPADLTSESGRMVLILPSGQATTQDLVTLMEIVTAAGVHQMRILRLEPRP